MQSLVVLFYGVMCGEIEFGDNELSNKLDELFNDVRTKGYL